MTALWTKSQWTSSPTAYWTVEYEYQRSGADMQYRFYWKVWLNTSTSWYYNGLQLRLFINGAQNNITVKGYNANEKGWSYDGTTGWYTVSNKTSGSVPFYAQLYDTNTKTVESTSSTYYLTVSPAQATLTSAPNFNDEENPTIYYSNPAGNDVTALDACITFTGSIDDIPYRPISKTGSSYTFNLTNAERRTLWNGTTENTRTVRFAVRTTIGTAVFYSTLEKTLSIVNANPTFTAAQLSYADIDADVVAVTGNNQSIVSGKSSLRISYTAATGNKSATISKYEFTLNGVTKTATAAGGAVDFGKVLTTKDLTLTVKVTDSRENSVTVTKNIPFILYSDPVIAPHSNYGEIICKRCNAEGVLDANGEYLKLAVKGKWNTLPSGKNTAKLQIKCVSSTYDSGWIDIEAEKQGGDEANNYIAWYDVSPTPYMAGITLDKRTIYTITIRMCDDLTSEDKAPTLPVKIPTSAATFHLGENGLKAAFGMYAQRDKALQIAEDWTLDVLGGIEIGGVPLSEYILKVIEGGS